MVKSTQEVMNEFFETHHYDKAAPWRDVPATAEDPDDDVFAKEFSASSSATSGLTGYTVEGAGQRKRKKRGPKYLARVVVKAQQREADLGLLVKRRMPRPVLTPTNVDKVLKQHEARVAGRLSRALGKEGARVAQALRSKLRLPQGNTRLARALSWALHKAAATEEEVDRILSELDLEGFAVTVMDTMIPELTQVFEEAGIEALRVAGIEATDEIVRHVDERAVQFAEERSAEMVGKKWVEGELVDNLSADWSILETTRDALRLLTTDAIEEGMSSQELADAIEESGEFGDARALMIARTELANAHVQGNLEGWRQSGVVTTKRWITAGSDVCDECGPMDGEEVDIEEDFSSGDDGPPLHPNCRCDVVALTDSETEEPQDEEADAE